jgi:hypothetical protein
MAFRGFTFSAWSGVGLAFVGVAMVGTVGGCGFDVGGAVTVPSPSPPPADDPRRSATESAPSLGDASLALIGAPGVLDGSTPPPSDGASASDAPIAASPDAAPESDVDGGSVAVPDGGSVAVPDGGSVAVPDGGVVAVPDSGTVAVPDGGSALMCAPPTVACADGCVDPQWSPTNCGGCGVVCPPADLCISGMCIAASGT